MLHNGNILEDCDSCPIRKVELCHPSTIYDREPPCAFVDEDIEAEEWIKQEYERIKRYEAAVDKRIKAERERKAKQEAAQKRCKESQWHVHKETEEIKRLKKKIAKNERILSRADSLAFAFNMTNQMFGYEERKQINPNNPLQLEIESCKKRIAEIEAIKKQKLKEFRQSRNESAHRTPTPTGE